MLQFVAGGVVNSDTQRFSFYSYFDVHASFAPNIRVSWKVWEKEGGETESDAAQP
ncbi:hypothetical protein [Cohnella nanjingensis]|uniref:hypothetical protein n=1 Tax=Cohnella nanjingensis TaxID=1387779 RepID=UPI001C884AA0|nr:hypothetical protein [Cohnella nanjingensis]